jgi:hypothetical protein
LAVISTSSYDSVLQPVGQMSLFAPHVMHRQMWKHITSGELVDALLRPFRPGVIVCKQMTVVSMEWLKRKQNWDGRYALWIKRRRVKFGRRKWQPNMWDDMVPVYSIYCEYDGINLTKV